MRVRDVVRTLEHHGFRLKRRRGSHRQYEGRVSGQRRLVTVAGKESEEVAPPTLASIGRQSGLPAGVFRRKRK